MLQRAEMHLKKEKSGINMNRLCKGMWWYNEIRIVISLWYLLIRETYLKEFDQKQDLYDYEPREIQRQQGGLWRDKLSKQLNLVSYVCFWSCRSHLGISSIVQWFLHRGRWSSLPTAVPNCWHPLRMILERKGSGFQSPDPFKSSPCQLPVVKVFAGADCLPPLRCRLAAEGAPALRHPHSRREHRHLHLQQQEITAAHCTLQKCLHTEHCRVRLLPAPDSVCVCYPMLLT